MNNDKCKILNWRALSKGTAIGTFTIILPSGLVIRDCIAFQKKDSRWLGMPRQRYTDKQGQECFSTIVDFRDRTVAESFRKMVFQAIDEQIRNGGK